MSVIITKKTKINKKPNQKNVHFDEWFDAQSIMKHQPAILAADFLENIAPSVWPADERIGFCVQAANAPVMCEIKSGKYIEFKTLNLKNNNFQKFRKSLRELLG